MNVFLRQNRMLDFSALIGFSYVSYSLRLSFVIVCSAQRSKCGSSGCRNLMLEKASMTFLLRDLFTFWAFSIWTLFCQIVGK